MLKDISGQRFGKVIALKIVGTHPTCQSKMWECKCDCGKIFSTLGVSLRKGETKSCGCLKKEINQKIGKESRCWRGYEEISKKFFNRIKSNASARNISFNLKIEEIWNLFLKQEKKCAISGIELSFSPKSTGTLCTASLDRIDSKKGYVIDNVQWVHKKINIMKKDMSDKEFFNWIKLIYLKNECNKQYNYET